jgi:hypothetical protein
MLTNFPCVLFQQLFEPSVKTTLGRTTSLQQTNKLGKFPKNIVTTANLTNPMTKKNSSKYYLKIRLSYRKHNEQVGSSSNAPYLYLGVPGSNLCRETDYPEGCPGFPKFLRVNT